MKYVYICQNLQCAAEFSWKTMLTTCPLCGGTLLLLDGILPPLPSPEQLESLDDPRLDQESEENARKE